MSRLFLTRSPHQIGFVWLVMAISTWGKVALADELTARIEAITSEPRFQQAHWGLLVVDRASGEALYEHQADKLFMPASTTKLFSSAAVLEAFGGDYRFRTPVYRRGSLEAEGRLAGDLILVASGDPTLGGRTTPEGEIAFTRTDHTYADGGPQAELTGPDPLAGLNALAGQVAAAGVRRVEGDVWIDDRLFDPSESTGSGPRRLTPIIVNDNVVDLVCRPGGEPGGSAQVEWRPTTALITVTNELRTAAAGEPTEIELQTRPATPPAVAAFVVTGRIALDAGPRVVIWEVPDAAQWARGLFIEALGRAGVTVDRPLGERPDAGQLPAAATFSADDRLAELVSPPLAEEIRLVLKVSHNLHASLFPLLLAVKGGKRTLADGLAAQAVFLRQAGVPVETISFGGGAGGARADYTTPRATVALLRHMAERPDFAVYRRALPVLGVDGTLYDAVGPESPARGAAQAKTGTFYWRNDLQGRWLLMSKALAGYLTTRQGREVAFAFFVNQVHLDQPQERSEIGQVLGRLVEVVFTER